MPREHNGQRKKFIGQCILTVMSIVFLYMASLEYPHVAVTPPTFPSKTNTYYLGQDKTVHPSALEDTKEKIQKEQSYKIIFDTGWSLQEEKDIEILTKNTIGLIDQYLATSSHISDCITTITINKEKKKSRGYSSHNSIIINYGNMNIKEYKKVLTHEIGHIVDFCILQGSESKYDPLFTEFGAPSFQKDDPSIGYYKISRQSENSRIPRSEQQDFCSIYSMSNIFEDFAECFQLYINDQYYFRFIAESSDILSTKYQFFTKIMPEYDTTIINHQEQDNTKRYRDTTKIVH